VALWVISLFSKRVDAFMGATSYTFGWYTPIGDSGIWIPVLMLHLPLPREISLPSPLRATAMFYVSPFLISVCCSPITVFNLNLCPCIGVLTR